MHYFAKILAACALALLASVNFDETGQWVTTGQTYRCDYMDAEGGTGGMSHPYVDIYGQKIAANWPEKVTGDERLVSDLSEEDQKLSVWTPAAKSRDAYGGTKLANWHNDATGFFRVMRHNDVWWLVTPSGNPCFFVGLDTAPALNWETTPVTGREELFQALAPNNGITADAWGGDPWGRDPGISSYSFCAANLMRKYGVDWKARFRAMTARRLSAWGFTGLGKWCDYLPEIPSTPVLNRIGVPLLVQHPDPFNDATASKLRDVLSAQIEPHVDDPNIVAWSMGNEGEEIITSGEIAAVMNSAEAVPAKRALIDYLLRDTYHGNAGRMAAAWGVAPAGQRPVVDDLYNCSYVTIPDSDLESMRRYYANSYYALIERTIKSIDPNHLYAGFWIVPGIWENESDWWLIAKHCDVIGYDNYSYRFSGSPLDHLLKGTGKPAICGEFSFPQDNTDRGFSAFTPSDAATEEESGKLYNTYAVGAARNRYCVGINWFQYRDQPITGRGPGHGPDPVYGENYAFGLVDITDRPKWMLVSAIRQTNLSLPQIRIHL